METAMTSDRPWMNRLLAGLLLASATLGMAQAAGPDGMRGHGGHGGMGMMMLGERGLDAINASAEQRSQLKQIFESARADLKAQRDSGRALHDQMRLLFTQPTVDARAAETLRQQKMALHDAGSKRMLQAMLEASRVLSPEQRAKLAELMAHRRDRMEQRGHR
jgi:periplasmic protein CpxP/Spy